MEKGMGGNHFTIKEL